MSTAARIGVIGAGAWGTALAQMLAADGAPVSLYYAHLERQLLYGKRKASKLDSP